MQDQKKNRCGRRFRRPHLFSHFISVDRNKPPEDPLPHRNSGYRFPRRSFSKRRRKRFGKVRPFRFQSVPNRHCYPPDLRAPARSIRRGPSPSAPGPNDTKRCFNEQSPSDTRNTHTQRCRLWHRSALPGNCTRPPKQCRAGGPFRGRWWLGADRPGCRRSNLLPR